jgi:hypothetical protein
VEVVGGLSHTQFRPKCLHDLLAVEAVTWGQSEQLHEVPGLPQAPLILFYNSRANPEAKAAEQANAHHLSLPTGLPTTATGGVAVLLLVLEAPSHPLAPYV